MLYSQCTVCGFLKIFINNLYLTYIDHVFLNSTIGILQTPHIAPCKLINDSRNKLQRLPRPGFYYIEIYPNLQFVLKPCSM